MKAGKKNIFKGAVLGDVYKTERGHKLVFCGKGTADDIFILVDRHANTFYYRSDGTYSVEGYKRDIASKVTKDEKTLTAPTYKELEEMSKKRYPSDPGKRIAFRGGALWFMKEVCPEVEDSMGIPKTTLDEDERE